jgi:xanthine dehydrogenase large subunit
MGSVGKNIPHDSAAGHVSGESIYIDDIPPAHGELTVDFFWSPVSLGRIRSLDLPAAAAVPGIVGLYTYADLHANRFGPIIKDELLLAEDVCTFMGQPIVVVAGESREAVRDAKRAIKIDIEQLRPVLTIDEAIDRRDFIGETRRIKRGDLDAAFASAEHLLEGTFHNLGQDHFYLESQAALVYPGENDTLTVHSSTQNPTEVQEVVAHLLGLTMNQVICLTKRMGGAFGGKECQATHPAAMAALVAHLTKRPARIIFNKDDDMQVTGKRHPFQNRYRVAFTSEGVITALKADLYSDGGAYADLSPSVMGRAMTHIDNAYFLPNVEITGTVCRTNFPPNTAFRGFGGPQGVATMENILEEIAIDLKKDPLQIRMLNCYGVNERALTPYGQVVAPNLLPRLFEELAQRCDYANRLAEIRKFNAESKTHLKGLAMTAVKFGISFNTKFLNQASALVNIFYDGTVQVSTGATEMGQGVNTKVRQLVADELGIAPEQVLVMTTSTEKNNNSSATAASSGADLNGGAAVDACRRLRERLAEAAVSYFAAQARSPSSVVRDPENGKRTTDHMVFEDGFVFDSREPNRKVEFAVVVKFAYLSRISLGERGFYATQRIDFDWMSGTGNPFLYFTMGTCASEVLIDRFTGQMRILRSDVLMDIGKPINPGIDRGQITGGVIQGIGWASTEELVYDEKGLLLSHSPTTYKIPNIQDVPEIFNVDWIDNDTNVVNIRGSKASNEPPLLLGISVWCAAKNALSYISNGNIPKLRLPASTEEILMCLTQLEIVSGQPSVAVRRAAS